MSPALLRISAARSTSRQRQVRRRQRQRESAVGSNSRPDGPETEVTPAACCAARGTGRRSGVQNSDAERALRNVCLSCANTIARRLQGSQAFLQIVANYFWQ